MNVRSLSLSLMLSLLLGCNAVVDGQCADGYESCKGACVPTGVCGMLTAPKCPEPKPSPSTPADAGVADATPPATCGDVSTDPFNCGACGNVCATATCVEGVCRGARVGDVVVIGHDYRGAAPSLAMSDVAANAVFMRARSTVRVLAWQQYADPAAVVGLGAVLDAEASRSGRRYVKSVAATADELAARISANEIDVALIFDQVDALPGELAIDGATLASPLRKFAEDGGVIVVLNGGRGVAEMPKLLAAADLADVTSQTDASGSMLDVTAPSDVVGSGVMGPYKATGGTVALTLGDPFAGFASVVSEPVTGKPIVIHRTVRRK